MNNDDDSKVKKKLFNFDFIKKFKKPELIIIAVLLVIIVLSFAFTNIKKKQVKVLPNKVTTDSIKNLASLEEFTRYTENRIVNVLSSMSGVSNVEVFVVAESGVILTIAEETDEKVTGTGNNTSKTISKRPVLNKNGSITEEIVLVEKVPKILGILVVANGASNMRIKLGIINALSTVFDMDANHIEVLEGKAK
ncbi:MAG: hypothetical protein RR334_03150 [Clostridia bacterium]